MLVLTRKKNEGITIGYPSGKIHVTVVEIRGDKVRIGIDAENEVTIDRDEIAEAIVRDGVRLRMTAGELLHTAQNNQRRHAKGGLSAAEAERSAGGHQRRNGDRAGSDSG